tara:strand:+ start:1133 stop:1312 length:180 start_codon:yes stop_codon:yes gene_type:complete
MKRYTLTVTYTTEIETNLSADEIEEGVWVGELEIAELADGTSVRADAEEVYIECEDDEE